MGWQVSAGARRVRLPRSAGTVYPQDLLRSRDRRRRESAAAADLEAIGRGDGRTVACLFRGSYGGYPRRFRQQMLDLTPDGLVIRPFWYGLIRRRYRIGEPVTEAHVRPRDSRTDWNVRATGAYEAGGRLAWAGFCVVHCTTEQGFIELAVPRPDVPLVLHYLHRISQVS
jgi:hypothetical protein